MKSWNLTKAMQAGMMASAAMTHAKFENTANRDVRNRRGLARKMRHIARNMVPKK